MAVKEPQWLITRPKASGRNQAAVKAQMPPDEMPQIVRHAGSPVSLQPISASTNGDTSSSRNRA
jgi:hypothetical protein